MDEFDNFFDDQRDNGEQSKTPIYHTPDPKRKQTNTVALICIIVSAVMCLVVVVNVIVLATLKNSIADEYAASMSQSLQEVYRQAIEDVLSENDVIDDVTQSATQSAVNALSTPIGKTANEQVTPSVARLYMYTQTNADPQSSQYSGFASGFIITDSTTSSSERYFLTNAHCVRYEAQVTTGMYGHWQQISYSWKSFGTFIAVFENDDTIYYLEPVAYGSYTGDYLSAEKDANGEHQADIALLKFVGTQPSNDAHPSLSIATSVGSATRGTEVALVGNPKGMGETNTVTVGAISQEGINISSWGTGTFLMTDAAVNGGNSGGPMVNSLGNVVGIVESKLVGTDIDNMGFALDAQTIVDFISWASLAQNNTLGVALNINYTSV